MATVLQQQGTFSVHFTGDDDETYSCDWSFWGFTGIWSVSRFNHGEWEPPITSGLTPEAHIALLERFGLVEGSDQLTIAKVCSKGPRALINIRRILESVAGLDELEVRSDTCGYDVLADEHID